MAVKQPQAAQTPQAGAKASKPRHPGNNRIVEFFDEYYLVGNMKDGSGRITGYNGSPVSPIYRIVDVGTLPELKLLMMLQKENGQLKTVFVKAESPVRRIYAVCELVPANLKRIVLNAINSGQPWSVSSLKPGVDGLPAK